MCAIHSVAVVGAGAVGCYYGARLAKGSEAEVSFLMRRDLEAVRKSGLHVLSIDGDFVLSPVQGYASAGEIGPVDLVIVATKTTSNDALPKLIAPLLNEDTAILTLQNGLGNEEFLLSQFPSQPILGGLCHVCINRGEPGLIHHLAHGRIEMGEFTETNYGDRIHALFCQAGLETRLLDDLGLARWRKLVWNVPFNGLSIAEGKIDTQQILSRQNHIERVRTLMHEVIEAANALGFSIEPSFADANIEKTCEMGAYRPSSLIDFEEGREVEVEAIWGEPLRQAMAKGISMPELSRLHEQICRAVESRSC
ncbi:MAG: 2-dehydropantoate 2-reductase [Verrucomicrobiota bacterium]